jgi:hypothetical protein
MQAGRLLGLLLCAVATLCSCHRKRGTPAEVEDLSTMCTLALAHPTRSDRYRLAAADAWLGAHANELKTPKLRDLAVELSKVPAPEGGIVTVVYPLALTPPARG